METEYIPANNTQIIKDMFTLDPNTGNTILLLGASKAGKSTFIMSLFNSLFGNSQDSCDGGYIPVLFSANKHAAIYKDKRLNNVLKCDKFDKNGITLINQCQKINKTCDNDYNFLFMFDDIIDMSSKVIIRKLILTYRNSNISSVISLQYPKLIQPAERGNINNVLFFSFNYYEIIESVIKLFLLHEFKKMGLKTMGDMVNRYKELTDDYHFLYFNPKKNILKRYKLKL